MNKKTLAVLIGLATLGGCAGHDPVDRVVYRDEPLVRDVEPGMSKERVLTVGGPPSSEVDRQAQPGSCNNYVLNHDGREQTYYVTFDGQGRVDGKGFTTCEEIDRHQLRHR